MAKRRKRSAAAATPPAPARKKKPRAAIVGDLAPGMTYPNHLVPVSRDWRSLFPLLHLQYDSGEDYRHVFYDQSYGMQFEDWPLISTPPTWMDPEYFVNVARKDPAVIKHMAALDKHNDIEKGQKAVTAELTRIMDDEYLPMLMLRFEKTKQLLAEWLVNNYCDNKLALQAEEYTLKTCAASRKRKGIVIEDVPEIDEEVADE